MTAPSRHYHTLHHLDLLWARHLQYRGETPASVEQGSSLIAFAIAYHDSVFVADASDNEARSAELWLDVSSTATNLNVTERVWVADTIRATADHLGSAGTIDLSGADGYARQWVLDLDLTPLGELPDLFDRNMDLLSAESTKPHQQADLLDGLRHFASAHPLFRCHPIAHAFEAAARRNFARHLDATVSSAA